MSRCLLSLQKSCAARGQRTTLLPKPRVVTPRGTAGWDGGRGMLCDFSCLAELAPQRLVILLPARSSHGPVAQWIRHRPTEPGIAGSSPAGVNCCSTWRLCQSRLMSLPARTSHGLAPKKGRKATCSGTTEGDKERVVEGGPALAW